MVKKSVIISATVVVLTGVGVLICWLKTRDNEVKLEAYILTPTLASEPETNSTTEATPEPDFIVDQLKGEGFGDAQFTAAFTKIRDVGDIFWWFYPTTAARVGHKKPLILWLDGVTGIPPSLLANLGMIGPYDINSNKRENSWVDRYNLLFIDAPLGTGFSVPVNNNQIPTNVDENAKHLAITLKSFYTVHAAYRNAPLYIFGQAHGAQLALALAINLHQSKADSNLRGVVLGNGIISPALAMTKLGFYLEELGYIDGNGRTAIESLSEETTAAVNLGNLGNAFDKFISMGQFVNENAGAIAVNLGHIVEKLTRQTAVTDYFGQGQYLRNVLNNTDFDIMDNVIGPALGIPATVKYDSGREYVIDAFRSTFMTPATDKVEYILQNTELTVSIYNGNLDAVSNTPGQLEWVDNLQWPGQAEFKAQPRETLVVNRLVEGYFRQTARLQFYWVNAAGQYTPLDNPAAMNVILSRILHV
uniref:Uncharacterized protein n=1 Tax=Heliothis virescens TaxID=7102 RepID=A0A2A4K3U2_HELVI